MEERFRKRLAIGRGIISLKGREQTHFYKKHDINIPIYSMSLLHLSRGVNFRLETIQRDFLRGGGNLERKIHFINLKTTCLSKEKGGLGIRSLSNLNRALLEKWNCWFAVDESSFRRKFITLKYGTDGGWFTQVPNGSYEGGCLR